MLHLAKRLEAAVLTLVGDGPVKQRLGQAYARYLGDLPIPDMPDSLRDRFAELHESMHKAPPIGKENSVKVTVRKMSFAEAAAHAETIVDLYSEILRTGDRVEPLKVVQNEEKPPRYLAGRS